MSSGRFDEEIGKRLSVGQHYYTIERVIAEGGYGVVFLVRDGFGKKLALKRIIVNDEGKLRDCRAEIELLSMLSGYKNIIKYVDSSVVRRYDGVSEVFIITEYYSMTCSQLIETRKYLTESEVLRIFCDLCEAISILHSCQVPIIHRDIKIENILMDQWRNYVLCDFGSATTKCYGKDDPSRNVRQLQEDFDKHTTKSHRAPEIIDLYTPLTISTKIDIWALGVTLYRLCFNSLPFGESALASQSGHITIPESSTYSEQLHALIHYHFEVDPDQRPDIYQISSIAFQLANKTSPVKNINNVRTPTVEEVQAYVRLKNDARLKKELPSAGRNADRSDWVETTSVQPRQRPKAGRTLNVPQLPTNAHYSSNPEINLKSNQQADQRTNASQTHSADLLGLTTPNVMSHSLDGGSGFSTTFPPASAGNPFGDDFSKLDPQQIHQADVNGGSTYPQRQSSQHQQLMGFEDSFTSLSLSASGPTQVGRQEPMPYARGHNRFGSDPLAMSPQYRGNNSHQHSATPMKRIDLMRDNTSDTFGTPGQPASPFVDDFSALTKSRQRIHSQGPTTPNGSHSSLLPSLSPVSSQLDPFGLTPFNPSTAFGQVSTSAYNSHPPSFGMSDFT